MNDEYEQADWTHQTIDPMSPSGTGKGGIIVLFRTVQRQLEKESEDQNRPVFEEVIHITKIIPADKTLTIDRPLRKEDKAEFPEAWARWQLTRSNVQPGIPIEHWHSINDTQKAEFKAMNIHTVEQFANLSDGQGMQIMGFQDLRRKAKVFLEAGKDAELLSKVRAEADAKTAALEKKLEDMQAMLEELTKPKAEAVSA